MKASSVMQRSHWAAFDSAAAAKQDGEQADREFASMVRATFEDTDAGKRVIERLVQQHLTQAIVQPNDTQFAAGIREGKAEVVRNLLRLIEFAKAER